MKNGFLFLLLLLSNSISGQSSKGLLLKTLVLQNTLFRNPNIIVESPLNEHLSFEVLVSARFSDFYSDGREIPVPAFQNCKGLTLGLGARYYLARTRKIPNSWYVAALFRYNDTYIEGAEIQEHFKIEPRRVNLRRRGPEGGILIGRQFVSQRNLTADFYAGCGTYIQYHEEIYISGPWMDDYAQQMHRTTRPYLGWSLGYYFQKRERKK